MQSIITAWLDQVKAQIKKRTRNRIYPFISESEYTRIELFPRDYSLLTKEQIERVESDISSIIQLGQSVRYIHEVNPRRYFVECKNESLNLVIERLQTLKPQVVCLPPTSERYSEDFVNDYLIIHNGTAKKYSRILYIDNLQDVGNVKPLYDLSYSGISVHYFFDIVSKSTISKRLNWQSSFNIPLPFSRIQKKEAQALDRKIDEVANNIAVGNLAVDFDIKIKLVADTPEQLDSVNDLILTFFKPYGIEVSSCLFDQLGSYANLDSRSVLAKKDVGSGIDCLLSDLATLNPFRYHVAGSNSGFLVGYSSGSEYYWDDQAVKVKHMFISGDSGSGKSQFLKNLLLKYKEDKNKLILILDGAFDADTQAWDFDVVKGDNVEKYEFFIEKITEKKSREIFDKEISEMILKFNERCLVQRKEGVIVLDEAHAYRKCTVILDVIDMITRNGRKQKMQIVSASQFVGDMMGTNAESLIKIAKRKIFLAQEEPELRQLVANHYISEQELQYVSQCITGEALIKISGYYGAETHIKRVKFLENF